MTMRVLSERHSIAHKDHGNCVACRAEILMGEMYVRYAIKGARFSFIKVHDVDLCRSAIEPVKL